MRTIARTAADHRHSLAVPRALHRGVGVHLSRISNDQLEEVLESVSCKVESGLAETVTSRGERWPQGGWQERARPSPGAGGAHSLGSVFPAPPPGAIPGGLSIGPPAKSSIDDSYGRYDLIQSSESPASPPVAVPHSWSRAKSDSDKISNGSSINWPPGKSMQRSSAAAGLQPHPGK